MDARRHLGAGGEARELLPVGGEAAPHHREIRRADAGAAFLAGVRPEGPLALRHRDGGVRIDRRAVGAGEAADVVAVEMRLRHQRDPRRIETGGTHVGEQHPGRPARRRAGAGIERDQAAPRLHEGHVVGVADLRARQPGRLHRLADLLGRGVHHEAPLRLAHHLAIGDDGDRQAAHAQPVEGCRLGQRRPERQGRGRGGRQHHVASRRHGAFPAQTAPDQSAATKR